MQEQPDGKLLRNASMPEHVWVDMGKVNEAMTDLGAAFLASAEEFKERAAAAPLPEATWRKATHADMMGRNPILDDLVFVPAQEPLP